MFIETWYVQTHPYPFSSRFYEIGMFGVRNHLYKLAWYYKLQANIITPYYTEMDCDRSGKDFEIIQINEVTWMSNVEYIIQTSGLTLTTILSQIIVF